MRVTVGASSRVREARGHLERARELDSRPRPWLAAHTSTPPTLRAAHPRLLSCLSVSPSCPFLRCSLAGGGLSCVCVMSCGSGVASSDGFGDEFSFALDADALQQIDQAVAAKQAQAEPARPPPPPAKCECLIADVGASSVSFPPLIRSSSPRSSSSRPCAHRHRSRRGRLLGR